MCDLRVSTRLRPLALEAARRRLRTAGKRRLQHSPAAITADFVKNGFTATAARSLVAQLLTAVVTTLQQTTTRTCADVLCFKVVVPGLRGRIQRSGFTAIGSSLRSFGFSRTTPLTAFVASAVESDAAGSDALRLLLYALMANRRE